jgi:hypothetical protein
VRRELSPDPHGQDNWIFLDHSRNNGFTVWLSQGSKVHFDNWLNESPSTQTHFRNVWVMTTFQELWFTKLTLWFMKQWSILSRCSPFRLSFEIDDDISFWSVHPIIRASIIYITEASCIRSQSWTGLISPSESTSPLLQM